MRVAPLASTLLFLALLLTASTAEEPVTPTPLGIAAQPSAEELKEIKNIRAALGPEFRIASKMFGGALPPAPPTVTDLDSDSLELDASSPASSLYLQATKPSVERTIRFLKLAEHDLSVQSQCDCRGTSWCGGCYSEEEKRQLNEAAKKCQELAKQLESLTTQARTASPKPAANALTPSI
ncbi:hypothetical protein M4951_21750 [Blastopirellula sp. J2-11]|uniref:hypothetical protein n=1 Tax=Blastopirellula sp. J2-11 TaxID=2943192 RepID=UPI0021C92D14|nr:hypothetical protein [Blastopirellula sp. J2-11]UUO05979.1 hypothetical protein M4951_21750 [Blastopirellula sp. J2-11]